jgi:SAM-dependent methyltransferase
MKAGYKYPGEELAIFEQAYNWKKYFAKYILPFVGEKVLEVGAGMGTTTIHLNNNTANEWVLLEPDLKMAEELKTKTRSGLLPKNCKPVHGTFGNLDQSSRFDTILYIDVLEHILHDKKELETAAGYLKSGGVLVVLSPAFPFLFSPFDKAIGHYRRYTRHSLSRIRPAGLLTQRMHYLDSIGFFASIANRLLLKQQYPSHSQVRTWDRFMIPVSKITDVLFFYSFGKSILGIWKKE